MNMAFYDDNLAFLRQIAWKNHMSVTQYVNQLISKDKSNYDPSEWKDNSTEESK